VLDARVEITEQKSPVILVDSGKTINISPVTYELLVTVQTGGSGPAWQNTVVEIIEQKSPVILVDSGKSLTVFDVKYEILLTSAQGIQGPPGQSSSYALTAGENILSGKIVYVGVLGTAVIADPADPYLTDSPVYSFAIATQNVTTGLPVLCFSQGIVQSAFPIFEVGKIYYLTTAGGLTKTLPTTGFLLVVGTAIALDRLAVSFGVPVVLR
jgi:hypothetical protein